MFAQQQLYLMKCHTADVVYCRWSVLSSHLGTVADPDISFGGHEAPRSSAEGARIEAPKAPREVGCGKFFSIFY